MKCMAAAVAGFVALLLVAGEAVGSETTTCAGAPDGTACNDLDACTTNDACLGGSCGAGGAATFAPAPGSPAPSGSVPFDVAVGDLNRDGKPDLAVVNNSSNDLTILLGTGTGTFNQATGSPLPLPPANAGYGPRSVAIADFDLDHVPDLAVVRLFDLMILHGDGAGGFTLVAGSTIAPGSNPWRIVAADLNHDGNPDVALGRLLSATVGIFLGDGTGHLAEAPGSPVQAGGDTRSLAVADFNFDTHPDLAVANTSLHTVTILLGDGTGHFAPSPTSPLAVGNFPVALVAADFNRDGKPDVAVANGGSRDVTILLGSGLGGFVQPPGSPINVGATSPDSIGVGDINVDGEVDIVVANPVKVLLGDGTGGFVPGSGPSDLYGHELATGDFNLDRRVDLALVHNDTSGVPVLLGIPSSLDCDDGAACTADECEPATGCTHAQRPPGSTCDDGDICSVQDRCDASGACGGDPADCNDADSCTVDHCDPTTGCTHTPDFEAPCDDGSPCTANDACDLYGACIGETLCDDADPCTVDGCAGPGPQCTHAPVACDDQNMCTVDFCDPETGNCTHTALPCGDGDPCTRDFCIPPQGCDHAPACDDAHSCTSDSCNPTTGACTYTPIDCDDGNPCTTDSCVGAGFCVHPQINCSDQNGCTLDACDPATGNCTHTTLQCDDGNPCTTDSCTGTGCRHVPPNCNDQNLCTLDSCDPATGGCIHTALQCDDGNPCTTDICAGTVCNHQPTNCSDQNACTVDVCNATGGCQHDLVSCDDGIPCTADSCDPTSGACAHPQASCCPGGADADGDGVPDECDCNPLDPLNLRPGNVPGLRFQNDKTNLVWDDEPTAHSYELVRGTRAQLPVGPGADESCYSNLLLAFHDEDRPSLGTFFWYVVRGRNDCGTGTYGSEHRNPGPPLNGPTRTTLSCP